MFVLSLGWACTTPVFSQPAPLVVGAVRDRDGRPVAGAVVRALDRDGKPAGSASTDNAGTFAVPVARPAARLEVECRYCAPRQVAVPAAGASSEPLIVIVTLYGALAEPGLSQRDYQVLPYRRPSDSLGLVPYLVATQPLGPYGGSVSDRGLNLGYALVLDQGAPTNDLAGQTNAFATVPGRAVQRVDLAPASDAYRYGDYAGGGTFVLDDLGDAPGALALDSGVDGAFAAYRRLGGFAPSLAESRDDTDGVVRQRAGLDYEGAFAGGVLRVGAVASDQTPQDDTPQSGVWGSLLHAAYATASRRYRTFADAAASQIGMQDAAAYGAANSMSSAVVGSLRVEHPAAVMTAFGVAGQLYTGTYAVPVAGSLDARLGGGVGYVEASGGNARASFDAGLSLSQLALQSSEGGRRQSDALNALLPSLGGRYALGGGFALRASISDSFRTATLAQLLVMPSDQRDPFERGSLVDAGIGYDDGRRFRLDGMLFRENLTGFVNRTTTGVGASLAWQVAPLISLRAWTLNDSADQYTLPLPYLPAAPLALSRGVVWASYANPNALRLDVILRRSVTLGPAETDLDGDVVLPLARGFALTAGTSRVRGTRTFYAGVRLP
jgi:hypothetical protein